MRHRPSFLGMILLPRWGRIKWQIGIGRRFITALSGTAFVWPLTVRAQQPNKIPRIGLLSPFAASDTALWDQAFLQGLRDLGWVDGKSIIVERRYAEGRSDRLLDTRGRTHQA